MIVSGAVTFKKAIKDDWKALVFFLLLSLVSKYAYVHFEDLPMMSSFPLGMLITAMSIFLGFQMGQCYDRWWEARGQWGALVNTRLDGLPQDETACADVRREIMYRHIAYVNALRIALRARGQFFDSDFVTLEEFLPKDEVEHLKTINNVPAQILMNQGKRIARFCSRQMCEQQVYDMINVQLNNLFDIQGACERIKRNSFPDRIRFHTHMFVWVLATLIPLAMYDERTTINPFNVITETVMSFIFVTIERLGTELRDPFESRDNDCPMTTLCRSIEIDLRQHLGEPVAKQPLLPANGIFM